MAIIKMTLSAVGRSENEQKDTKETDRCKQGLDVTELLTSDNECSKNLTVRNETSVFAPEGTRITTFQPTVVVLLILHHNVL